MVISRRILVTVSGLAAALCAPVLADFDGPSDYGWNRGDADSTYFEWDYFTNAGGGNDPDIGQFPDVLPGDWIDPDVVETTGDGLATGSGNIYSPFGPQNYEITVPNYGYGTGETTLLLQIRGLGTELDYANVTLEGALPDEIIELYREETDMGWIIDVMFVFTAPGNADQYVFTAPTVEAHFSLDRVAVDTVTQSACYADFNGDGVVDTRDVVSYLNAWNAKDPSADANNDGVIDTRDFIAFLNLWNAGC